MNEKQIELTNKEGELAQLRASLSTNTSKVGDWKIMKCMEAQLAGSPMPYDVEELMIQRQYVRDRINEVEEEIKVLKEEAKVEMEAEMAQAIAADYSENA